MPTISSTIHMGKPTDKFVRMKVKEIKMLLRPCMKRGRGQDNVLSVEINLHQTSMYC